MDNVHTGSILELEHKDGSALRLVVVGKAGNRFRCRTIAIRNDGQWESRVGIVSYWDIPNKNIETVSVIDEYQSRVR